MTDPVNTAITKLGTDFDAYLSFNDVLLSESERGCALIGSSFLASQLDQLLREYPTDNKDGYKELLDPDNPAASEQKSPQLMRSG